MPKQAGVRAFCSMLTRWWATVGNWGTDVEHIIYNANRPRKEQTSPPTGETATPTPDGPSTTLPLISASRPLPVCPIGSSRYGRAFVEYCKLLSKLDSELSCGVHVVGHPVSDCAACFRKIQLFSYDMCLKCIQLDSAAKQEVIHDVCAGGDLRARE